MAVPLSRELAQRIVDEVSPSLGHDVNIMDRTGIIIASSDASRLDVLHVGAQQAARTGRPAIIRAGDEPEGAKAGINLPLRLDDELVGVVGLTGDPALVMPVAQVLVLTIGLLLTRERELDVTAQREARDRDLLSRLINGRSASTVTQALASDSPQIPPPWRLSAVIAVESAGSAAAKPPEELQQITRRLDGLGRFRLAAFQGALWVLGRAHTHDDAAVLQAAGTNAILIRGDDCADPRSLEGSAKTLAALVARPCFLPSRPGAISTRDLGAELGVACLPAEISEHLAARVSMLTTPQTQTVSAYFEAALSVSATARMLFTHRNTVIQRLDRVSELTGLDPRESRQAVTLLMALIASRRTGQNDHLTVAPLP